MDGLGTGTPKGYEELNVSDLIRTKHAEEDISWEGETAYNWASGPSEPVDFILELLIQVTYLLLYAVPEPMTFLSSALVARRAAREPKVDPPEEPMTEVVAQDEFNAGEGIIDTIVATSSETTHERTAENGEGKVLRPASPGDMGE